MRRCDEIQAAEVTKSSAELAAEAKAEREKKIRASTIDSVTGGIAMNFYRLLSEEQVGHMQYIYKIIRIHMHIYIQTDVDTTGIYTFTKINKQT